MERSAYDPGGFATTSAFPVIPDYSRQASHPDDDDNTPAARKSVIVRTSRRLSSKGSTAGGHGCASLPVASMPVTALAADGERNLEGPGSNATTGTGMSTFSSAHLVLSACPEEAHIRFVWDATLAGLQVPWPRCQELEALPDAFAQPRAQDLVVAVSHAWNYQTHPDPLGEKAPVLNKLLFQAKEIIRPTGRILAFVDFLSIAQRPFAAGQHQRSALEDRAFSAALRAMPSIYLYSDAVLLIDLPAPRKVPGEGRVMSIPCPLLDSAVLREVGEVVQVVGWRPPAADLKRSPKSPKRIPEPGKEGEKSPNEVHENSRRRPAPGAEGEQGSGGDRSRAQADPRKPRPASEPEHVGPSRAPCSSCTGRASCEQGRAELPEGAADDAPTDASEDALPLMSSQQQDVYPHGGQPPTGDLTQRFQAGCMSRTLSQNLLLSQEALLEKEAANNANPILLVPSPQESAVAPFDIVVALDGKKLRSASHGMDRLKATASTGQRPIAASVLKAPFGKRNTVPADQRGWIYLEHFIAMVKVAMTDETEEEATRIVFANTDDLRDRIIKAGHLLKAAAHEGKAALHKVLEHHLSVLTKQQFTSVSTDRMESNAQPGAEVSADVSDTEVVRTIMEDLVLYLEEHWADEVRVLRRRKLYRARARLRALSRFTRGSTSFRETLTNGAMAQAPSNE